MTDLSFSDFYDRNQMVARPLFLGGSQGGAERKLVDAFKMADAHDQNHYLFMLNFANYTPIVHPITPESAEGSL